jgi:AraC-like DNA-binding protein
MQSIKRWFNAEQQLYTGFIVRGLGIQELMHPGIVNRPQGTHDWLFMFFYDPVLLEADGKKEWHQPPLAMIWDDHHGHYYGNTGQNWKHSWIHVRGEEAQKLIANSELPLNQPFPFNALPLVEHYLHLFLNELAMNSKPDGIILYGLFHCWLREIVRWRHTAGGKPEAPERIRNVKLYIENHYTEPLVLADLARRANYSVPHFCSEFRKYFGCSALAYAIQMRLNMAAYYLRDHNVRVGEVAARVGYDDIYYFSRLFKKHFGHSPRQARKQ